MRRSSAGELPVYIVAIWLVCALAMTAKSAEPDGVTANSSLPTCQAAYVHDDFNLTGELTNPHWKKAKPIRLDRQTKDGAAAKAIGGNVRVLWSDKFLYVGYSNPFTKLTFFEPAELDKERIGLWDRDVVEAFINADAANLLHYTEFELAPNGEKLDLVLKLPDRDFKWSSKFVTAVKVNDAANVWSAEMKIPLDSLGGVKPSPGTRWRINFYRHDTANNAFLAWSPTLNSNFHTPEKFGVLEFAD